MVGNTEDIMQLDNKAHMYECLTRRGFNNVLIPTTVLLGEKVLEYLAQRRSDNQILFVKHTGGTRNKEVHRGTAEQLLTKKKLASQLKGCHHCRGGNTWVIQPSVGIGTEVRVYTRFDDQGGKLIMPAFSILDRKTPGNKNYFCSMQAYEQTTERPLFYKCVSDILEHVHLPSGMSTRIVAFDFVVEPDRVFLLEINTDEIPQQSLRAACSAAADRPGCPRHVRLQTGKRVTRSMSRHTCDDRWNPATYLALAQS